MQSPTPRARGLILSCLLVVQGCSDGRITLQDQSFPVEAGPGPGLCPGGEDKDGDGYGPGCALGPDCDDGSSAVNAGAKELCDGKDNDCDTEIDNGCVSQSDIEAMCRNGRMDSYEGGVDCGGSCPNPCPNVTGNATVTGEEGSGVELWMAVAALGLLIMGATGVFIVFSKKTSMD